MARGPVPTELSTGWPRMYAFLAQEHPDVLRALLCPVPSVVCWATERARLIPAAVSHLIGFLKGSGMKDSLGILSAEPSGPSLLVIVPYAEDGSGPAADAAPARPGHRAPLLRDAASPARLGAGAATAADALPPDVEAVLDPSGKVHHARGGAEGKGARASLAEIVRRVEHARGRLRHTDPEEALAIWHALFDGRWSVVERTESDGRRFLLARRNPPGERDPKALTQGERDVLACAARGHSNKYIGYLLGVATSTVSSRLESALRKLGLTSRREAIEMLAGGVPSA